MMCMTCTGAARRFLNLSERRCQKPCLRVSIRSHTNQAVQPQKMARGLQFLIYDVGGLFYLCKKYQRR